MTNLVPEALYVNLYVLEDDRFISWLGRQNLLSYTSMTPMDDKMGLISLFFTIVFLCFSVLIHFFSIMYFISCCIFFNIVYPIVQYCFSFSILYS